MVSTMVGASGLATCEDSAFAVKSPGGSPDGAESVGAVVGADAGGFDLAASSMMALGRKYF